MEVLKKEKKKVKLKRFICVCVCVCVCVYIYIYIYIYIHIHAYIHSKTKYEIVKKIFLYWEFEKNLLKYVVIWFFSFNNQKVSVLSLLVNNKKKN